MISKLLSLFCGPAKKSNVRLFKNTIGLLLVLMTANVQAQVSSYSFSSASLGGGYTAISGASLFGTTWNDVVTTTPVPLGLNFNFNGKVYTEVNVSSNGFITFGSTLPGISNYAPISSTESYEGAISAYGFNLQNAGASTVSYLTQTVSGYKTFTVEYVAYRVGSSVGAFNMQIILHESVAGNPKSGYVEILYKATSFTNLTNIIQGQIGLRGESNVDFKNLNYQPAVNANWALPIPSATFTLGTQNTHVVRTRSSGNIPASGIQFTWTPPNCFAPKAVTAIPNSITDAEATISWTPSSTVPASGYEYLIANAPANLNNGYPIASTPTAVAVPSGTSVSLSLLSPSTTYYVYVRSLCASPTSGWSVPVVFTTRCTPVGVPYTWDFEENIPPAVNSCYNVDNVSPPAGAFGYWYSEPANADATTNWGFPTKHMRIKAKPVGFTDNESTFATQGIQLTGGVSYRIEYYYGSSTEFGSTEQSIKVYLGTSQYAAGMTTPLAEHLAFKGGPYYNVVNVTAPSTGVYYLGFTDVSVKGNATTLLDNINIGPTTCMVPPFASMSSGGVTENTAVISWGASTPVPGAGYHYYVSSSATPPIATTVPTGSTNATTFTASIGGLTPGTLYYYYVRSNCGNGDTSAWTLSKTFTTLPLVDLGYCLPSGATYFQDPQGITNVTIGTINNTTGIEANNYGNYSNLQTSVAQGQVVPFSITYRTNYSYNTKIWVDWNNNGNFTDSGEEVYVGESISANPAVLSGTFTVPAGALIGLHRLRIGGIDFGPGGLTPCRTGSYQAFEDYSIRVTAPSPPIVLSSTAALLCANTPTSTITVTVPTGSLATYDTYTWSPNIGVTGTAATGYTLSNTETTRYTLTGLNLTDYRTSSVVFNLTIKPSPTAVTVSPAAITRCQSAARTPLTVSGGLISGTVFSDNFNGPTTNWVVSPSSGPGIWSRQPNGYRGYASNDASQFFMADSDATARAGAGSLVTTLTSPQISFTGYTSAVLSFWHHYDRFNGGESGIVQISADGTTWAGALLTYGSTDVGTPTGFVNATVAIPASIITAGVGYIRFTYSGTDDWRWSIDNVLITGTGPSAYTWSPTTGLYVDASSTTLYTGGPAATVYAEPNTDTVYTVTATGAGCTTTNTTTVTVTPVILAEPTPLDQTACSGVATDNIVMTIPVGASVTKWQYATTAAFTTPLDIAVTTATLTPAQITAAIGIMTNDLWFRAVVNGCGVKNSEIVKISVPSTTWNGSAWSNFAPDATKMVVFAGNATIGTDLNACALVVKSGDVLFNSGATATVTHAVTVDGGTLTFSDDASLLQTTTSNTVNTGDIKYIRESQEMVPYDYTYWSSPVQFQTLFNFSPDTRSDKFYEWDPVAYHWAQIATPALAPMVPGKGYIIRAPYNILPAGETFSGEFVGIPNNGTITQTVYADPLDLTKNINLLGNPYPSALDAETMMKDPANATSLGGGTTLYFWTHNHAITAYNYNDSDYATYNYTGGTGVTEVHAAPGPGNVNIPTRYIAAGQGFLVAVKGSGFTSVVFNNNMRTAGNNGNFYKTAETTEKHRIWLELKGNELYKQILVGYIDGATDAYDNGYDGEVMDGGNGISFYSFIADAAMNTQGKALPFNDNDEIRLGYKVAVPGMFEIAMPQNDGIFSSQAVYLEDKLLHIVHDLRQGTYSFATEAGTFDSRFVLKYVDTTLGSYQPVFDENAVVVYKDRNGINFKSTGFKMDLIKIYDANGRELLQRKGIDSNEAVISNLSAAQQVLLIKITSNEGVTINKKIIF